MRSSFVAFHATEEEAMSMGVALGGPCQVCHTGTAVFTREEDDRLVDGGICPTCLKAGWTVQKVNEAREQAHAEKHGDPGKQKPE